MKNFCKMFICIIPALLVLSCGSGGSGSVTSDQVNAISAAMTGAMSKSEAYTKSLIGVNGLNDVTIDSTKISCNSSGLSCTGTINETYNCPAGGHITTTGNMSLTCTSTQVVSGVTVCASADAYRASMTVVFHVSDATNNLNDCNIGNNVVLDGTVNLTVSGMINALTANINGTIDVDTIGTSGGLTPIMSSCEIFISFPSGGKASGTICGNTVS